MGSIARVSECTWSKGEAGGVTTYRLVADQSLLRKAKAERQAKIEEARKRIIEGRRRLLANIEAAGEPAPTGLDPITTDLAQTAARHSRWLGCLPQLMSSSQPVRDAWLNGDGFLVDMKSMPDEARHAVLSSFGASPPDSGGSIEIGGVEQLAGRCYTLGSLLGNAVVSVSFPINDETIGGSIYMVLSESMIPAAQQTGSSAGSSSGNGKDTAAAGGKPARKGSIDLGESLNQHPDDPATSAKIKMTVQGDRAADVFAALSDASGFATVSDGFDPRLTGIKFDSGEVSLRSVLDKLQHDYRFNWEKRDRNLELHSRDWFKKLDTLVPEAKLESWRKAFKDQGYLDIGDLSQIVLLTSDQMTCNVTDDDILGSGDLTSAVLRNSDVLTLYANLNDDQRALLFSDTGLDTEHGLSVDLAAGPVEVSAMHPLGVSDPSILGVENVDGLRLVGTREKHEKQTKYSFSLLKQSGEASGNTRTFETPLYRPPKEPTPAK
jgi:hypothetical protein